MKKINVKGPIISSDDKWIYEWLDMESTAPKDITDQLPEDGEEIEVYINSGGGDVYAGSEIYTVLKDYKGSVTVKIVGIAASAASVIAMAGDKVQISPTAQLMIHNVSMGTGGDHNEFEKCAEILKSHDRSIASSYEIKTRKSLEELLNLMNEETWMDAQSAVDNGFADEVMFQNEAPKLVASINSSVLNQATIDKVKALKNNQSEDKTADLSVLINQAVNQALDNREEKNIINKGPEEPLPVEFKGFFF